MNKYIDLWRLKIKGYIIIDDFFPDEICTELREYMLNTSVFKMEYWDYKSIDFDLDSSDDSLKDISEKYVVPKISLIKQSQYRRGWSFLYNNVARGVVPHADPSFININIWVTPDECVADHNKNGLKIFNKKAPKEWNWKEYNRMHSLIEDYLKDSEYARVPYRYNRAVIFRGNTFHETDHVHMKEGDENRRVNYTFLYN
jgi:hypothetical protein